MSNFGQLFNFIGRNKNRTGRLTHKTSDYGCLGTPVQLLSESVKQRKGDLLVYAIDGVSQAYFSEEAWSSDDPDGGSGVYRITEQLRSRVTELRMDDSGLSFAYQAARCEGKGLSGLYDNVFEFRFDDFPEDSYGNSVVSFNPSPVEGWELLGILRELGIEASVDAESGLWLDEVFWEYYSENSRLVYESHPNLSAPPPLDLATNFEEDLYRNGLSAKDLIRAARNPRFSSLSLVEEFQAHVSDDSDDFEAGLFDKYFSFFFREGMDREGLIEELRKQQTTD